MKAEIMREFAEEMERDVKVEASETLCVLLNNAICYMQEQGMEDYEIAEYLGTDIETLNAIADEDYEKIAE